MKKKLLKNRFLNCMQRCILKHLRVVSACVINYERKGTLLFLKRENLNVKSSLIVFWLLIIMPSVQLVAQSKIVTGKVADEKGVPIAKVTVTVKGSSTGTTTDDGGKFQISAPADGIIIFSGVGVTKKEVPVQGEATINIQLSTLSESLENVVVVSYGTKKMRDITGAISHINGSEVRDMPVINIGQKLQGKFAGVQVQQNSGEPNGGISFRIRGQASVNAGNSPLIVIDGFPTTSGLETLSPDEIESISVLKDASASALYGSRAANGVILVTTRTAKSGVTNIEFSSYFGIEKVSDRGKPDVMNAQEFARFKKEFYEDAAKYDGYTGGVPEQYKNPDAVKDGTNWLDLLLRKAPTQNYNLSISTGEAKVKSAININYNKQDGVILNTFAERFAARANNLFTVSDKLTLGLNLAGSYRNSQIIPSLGGGRNLIASAFLMDPALKYKNDDGTYPVSYSAPGMFPQSNYYLVLTQKQAPTKQIDAIVNSFAELEILKGLKYKLSANVNLGSRSAEEFTPSTAVWGFAIAPPRPATGSYSTSNYLTWLIENTLSYTKTLNGKHNFDALVGYTSQESRNLNATINASLFPDDAVNWFDAATIKTGTGTKSKWNLLSYIGQLNYNFDGKYLMSMAFRRDGSSRFGSNAKWGNFPSVSLGWIVSDEGFMKNMDKLSFLKLRGSYGKVGNNNIGDYTSIASVVTANYVFDNAIIAGRAPNSIGNSGLTWETTVQFDLGVDIGLFNNRIQFVYDFYRKKTNGLLYQIDIPFQAGFRSIQSNIGEFRFWGHEFAVETKNFVGEFRWSTNLNITFNRNKAIKLGTNNTPIGGYNNYDVSQGRTQVGHPLGEFMGYVNDGVYMTQQEFDSQPKHATSMVGTSRLKDIGGPNGKPDGVIDIYDRTIIGDPNPDFQFGITNEFSYKNFDASLVMAGSVGGDIFNGAVGWTNNLDGVFNVTKDVANRWRSPENPGNGIVPRTKMGTTEPYRFDNSMFVSDGSYLAVKNITVGYTVPIKNSPYIKSTRLYFSSQNALMITSYKGMNPEASLYGSNGLRAGHDFTSYPISIVYTAGVNVKF